MGLNKNIFVLDNDLSKMHIPKDIGIRFKENEQLKELIKQSEKQKITYDLAYYFNPDWKKNYNRFLEEKVGIA
jgi:PP-loop superfamily ATP-utilizing enzyme